MGRLKEDIQAAFEASIDGKSDRITQLATDLETAIEKFIVAQPFTVKKLSATAVGVQGTTAPTTATGANAGGPVASVVNPTGVSIPKITELDGSTSSSSHIFFCFDRYLFNSHLLSNFFMNC